MMDELIRRIEEAGEGSRELDAEVYNACPEEGRVAVRLSMERWEGRFDDGWRTVWRDREDKYPESLPHYTTNLQDAVGLVPEGWRLDHLKEGDPSMVSRQAQSAYAGISPHNDNDEGWARGSKSATAATPALALCAASLRARKEG